MAIASVTISWTPEAFMDNLNQRVANGLNAAAGTLARQIAANVVDRTTGMNGFAGTRGGASLRAQTGAGWSTVSMGRRNDSVWEGQFPSNQTGALRDSIRVKSPASASKLVAVVGSVLGDTGRPPYDKYLEFGTSKMAPRPFIRPAVRMAHSRMKSAFDTASRGPAGSAVGSPSKSPSPVLNALAAVR